MDAEKIHEAAGLINEHIMRFSDPSGVLTRAINILDHEVGSGCPVCEGAGNGR